MKVAGPSPLRYEASSPFAQACDQAVSGGPCRATTLVVGCTQDQMVPRTHSLQLFGAIDDARYTEIDSGHAVVFERPAELLRLVDTFLRQPSASAAGSIIPTARP